MHNIGALFRTADGIGVTKLILSGYTPYPDLGKKDTRLPHLITRQTEAIHKTALGAEATVPFTHQTTPDFEQIRRDGYTIAALEQNPRSVPLPSYPAPQSIALLLGEEVNGLSDDLLNQCDIILEIPMFGNKESFNVSVAAAMALYQIRFRPS